jgi:hypothetical protein
VVYKLSEGPAKKRNVFVAENCTPTVSIGQKVHSWTTVCNMHNSYPNIEMGWARGGGSDHPLARGYYSEGQKTAHGANFNYLMTYLGVPSGTSSGRPTVGHLSENFPRWPH